MNTEPNYTDRDYQKTVLDAAWEGKPCEVNYLSRGWIEGDLAIIFAGIYSGKQVRVKPLTAVTKIPLTAEDIIPGSAIRNNPPSRYVLWWLVTKVTEEGVGLDGKDGVKTFSSLMDNDEIMIPGEDWKPCYKIVEQ